MRISEHTSVLTDYTNAKQEVGKASFLMEKSESSSQTPLDYYVVIRNFVRNILT